MKIVNPAGMELAAMRPVHWHIAQIRMIVGCKMRLQADADCARGHWRTEGHNAPSTTSLNMRSLKSGKAPTRALHQDPFQPKRYVGLNSHDCYKIQQIHIVDLVKWRIVRQIHEV
jgi:hypothetical protein